MTNQPQTATYIKSSTLSRLHDRAQRIHQRVARALESASPEERAAIRHWALVEKCQPSRMHLLPAPGALPRVKNDLRHCERRVAALETIIAEHWLSGMSARAAGALSVLGLDE
jgi:hypothetical protein